MFNGFLVFLLFLLNGIVNSSEINVPDIQELLQSAELNKIADRDKFESSLTQLNKLKDRLNDTQKDELSYLSAFQNISLGEYEKAITQLTQIIYKTRSIEIKIRSHVTLSNLYAFIGYYEKAFNSLKFVSSNLEEVTDSKIVVLSYLAMANTYYLSGHYELSLKFSQLVLNQELDSFTTCRAKSFYIAASISSNTKQFTEPEIKSHYELCDEHGEYSMGHFVRSTWMSYQVENFSKPFDKTKLQYFLDEFEKEPSTKKDNLLKSALIIELSIKAKIHWMLGQFDVAEQLAKQVIESPDTMGDNEPRITAYQVLEALAIEAGDHVSAYNYLSKLSEIEAAFNQDNQMKQMAYMNVQHANLANELENEQLNKANKLLKVQQKLDRQETVNNQLLLMMLLMVLSILIYVVFRMRKKHNELESLAAMDHLTKVLNRKGFEVAFVEVLETANNSGHETHLAILDLDFFKRVNDDCGHLTGDWILKHVVYEVKKHLDSKMIIGRLGGEEFGILGSNMTSKDMDSRVEQLRKSIEELDCSDSGHEINITASFGITSSELSGHTMQMMLGHADLALYQAKSRGRNQWVRYQYIN